MKKEIVELAVEYNNNAVVQTFNHIKSLISVADLKVEVKGELFDKVNQMKAISKELEKGLVNILIKG